MCRRGGSGGVEARFSGWRVSKNCLWGAEDNAEGERPTTTEGVRWPGFGGSGGSPPSATAAAPSPAKVEVRTVVKGKRGLGLCDAEAGDEVEGPPLLCRLGGGGGGGGGGEGSGEVNGGTVHVGRRPLLRFSIWPSETL